MKKISKAERIRRERQRTIDRYIQDYLNGHNDGGNGNAFELKVVEYVVPRTKRVKVQGHDKHDLMIKLNGKYRTFEVKTGAGEIVKFTNPELFDSKVDNYSLQTLLENQKSEAIIYSFDGNIETARVFTKEEFFDFLRTYPSRNGNPNGMFQKMSGVAEAHEEGYLRLKIAVGGSSCKAKREWLLKNIHRVGVSLTEFVESRA